ncbi:hypothetical protein N0V86_001742 [Didymella sp. IMI 355093]|nr:hypothetical protein N0V86_001742 [Didymella sp. IMI 355093]
MDDEAAAEQLMSEAQASRFASHDDNAIPLSLDGMIASKADRKKLKKARKLEKLGKSDRSKKSERKYLAGSQTSRSQLPTHASTDLQALVAESPSKSQNLPSTAPSTQIEVPNSQVANGVPTSTPATSGHVASQDDTKSNSTKRKRKRQLEADPHDVVIPATPHKVAGEGQSSQKRRKKRKEEAPIRSADADTTEVVASPGATQDISSQPTPRDKQDGASPAPLIPKALLQNLNAERLQRLQGSHSKNRTPTSVQRKQETAETTPVDVSAEESMEDLKGELPYDFGADITERNTGATQNLSNKKRKKKSKNTLEAPKLDWDAPARNLDDTPLKLTTFDDVDVTEPTESHRKEKKRRKKSTKSEDVSKSSRYSVGGLPRSPSKRPPKHDPNKNYERARVDDDRTAADKALESSIDLGHPPELRTSGDYSSDENELLRRAIRDFQQREGLETADLVGIIQWMPTKEATAEGNTTDQAETELKKQSAAFWEEVKGTGLRRNTKNVKEHVRATYHTYYRGPWSVDEDGQLRKFVELYPNQWKLIATHMNRLRADVFNRWKDYVQHGEDRVTKRWSPEEEENFVRVISLVCQRIEDQRAETGKPPLDDYLSSINWSEVCKEMGDTRSRLQCLYKLKQMRARVPPPTFDIEIKPRRTLPPDDVETESELHTQADGQDESHANSSKKKKKKKKRQSGTESVEKQSKKQATKPSKRQDFKSRELITESDNAESEPEV